ncbi:MAG: transposase [Sphingomonadales bacterium]|nr:transposase [Sphingomonadales bacterium]
MPPKSLVSNANAKSSKPPKPPGPETVSIITSLSKERCDADALLQLVRGHWAIENTLHFSRDRTYDEDRCQIRNPRAAQAMAALRNLAISINSIRRARIPSAQRSFLPSFHRSCSMRVQRAVHLVAGRV